MGEEMTSRRQTIGKIKDLHLDATADKEEAFSAGKTAQEFRIELFQKYRSTFDRAGEAVFILQNGRFVFANRKMTDLLGVPVKELEGLPFPDLVWPVDRDLVVMNYWKRVRGEYVPDSYEFRIIGAGGRSVWVSLSTTLLMPEEGETAMLYILADVTERRRMEKALKESESKYRALMESTSAGIYLIQGDTFIYVNPAFEAITGYTLPELAGIPFWDFIHPDFRELVKGRGTRRQEGTEPPERYEFKIILKSGEVKWIELSAATIDLTSKPTIMGSMFDITDRMRAEKALRESEERYKNLVEKSLNGVYVVQEGRFAYLNDNAASFSGYSPEELVGLKSDSIVHPDDRSQKREWARKTLRGEESSPHEFRIVTKDGSIRWILESVTSIQYGGRPAILGNSMDITDRKRVEKDLMESEKRFRALCESAPDIIYTLDLSGNLTYVNPSWERILGHGEDELTGRSFTEFAKEKEGKTLRKLFKGIRDEGKAFSNHIGTMLNSDGAERIFIMNSAILRDSEDRINGFLGMMKDITELRDMEKKLNQAQKMEAIGTLAGGIAHDFNNLLMGIQGYASLTLLELEPSHPYYDRLKRIEEQVKSGTDLTGQLLGLARGGRYEVKPSDMNDILTRTSSMFGRTKKEISIHRKFANDLWNVEVDRGQMEQVLMNLYVNAWQAMPGGGEMFLETENVSLDDEQAVPYAAKPGRYVKIQVTDTGTGMDRKTMERIFDPFFTTKSMGRGTGLGLAMVYGIIKGHGGTIHVESEPGHGSTFIIHLPATDRAVVLDTKEIETVTRRGTETILLVEDERTVAEVTRELLISLGYRVYVAGSGQEAVATYMVKKGEIDLVILDMIMPGLSGGETFDLLREINPELRIILSSGYSINGQAQDIMDRGCDGFLQKPFYLEQLSGKIRGVLD